MFSRINYTSTIFRIYYNGNEMYSGLIEVISDKSCVPY